MWSEMLSLSDYESVLELNRWVQWVGGYIFTWELSPQSRVANMDMKDLFAFPHLKKIFQPQHVKVTLQCTKSTS